ncbi:hypothetical protein [Deinococcus radiotolerans]|uniref:Uncharacterized protein n=1 Tax=Deinococcus radiotolerans TaxID=1309407 RepID=A0ABQ2FRP8_9DEIO|nr:hypothetical protein [Deinococcus radiotolerans]GGL20541.1 hypothetical protein GCM10010844_44230 [Deinococcus radiotolerans]
MDTLRSALHARWRAAALTLAQEPPLAQATVLLDRLLRDDPFDPDALDLLPLLEPLASDPDVRRLAAQLGAQHQQDLGTPDPRVQALVELTGREAGER